MQKKQIEKQVAMAITKPKKYIKTALVILASLALLYLVVFLTTKKEQIPVELQTKIDSLTKVSAVLAEKQRSIDSTIKLYQTKVDDVDIRIANIKQRTIIIKKYYHKRTQVISTYTPTQIDSFFKDRYNY